jgi:hypothetical protein
MRVYVLIGLAALVASCGDAPTAPTPQPAPAVVAPVTPIAPLAPAAVVEPFCPFLVVDNLTASRREGRVEVSWNVTIGPAGQYLHRYQIEVRRRTGDDKAHEVQVDSLSGPHNRRAVREITPEGTPEAVRVRGWYPDECHGTDRRLNTPWSSWRDLEG